MLGKKLRVSLAFYVFMATYDKHVTFDLPLAMVQSTTILAFLAL
jgi:hypothetical protein